MPKNLVTPVELLPHPVNAANRIFQYEMETRAVEGDSPIIQYVGTDISEDRYGSVIDPKGCDSAPYMKSGAGMFLFGHDYSLPPIGKCIDLEQKGNRLIFTIRFASDIYEGAAVIYRLVKEGYMPGSSIGFIPLEWVEYEAKTVTGYFAENRKYTKWELLELSAVTVPANRNALKLALDKNVVTESELRQFGLDKFIRGEITYLTTRAFSIPKREAADDTICPECKKPMDQCECDKGTGTDTETEKAAKTCDECGKPMTECVCEAASKAKKEKEAAEAARADAPADDEPEAGSPAEAVKELNDAVKELMQLWKASDQGDDDLATVMDALDDAEERIDEAVAALKKDATDDTTEKSARAGRRATRAGAELSKKNRARLATIKESLRTAHDDLQQLLADADKEQDDTTETTAAETTQKDAGEIDKENRCLDESVLLFISEGMSSLLPTGGETGATPEGSQGSRTVEGDRESPATAAKGRSPVLDTIMRNLMSRK